MRDLFAAELDYNIALIPGDGGVFNISYQNELLYSKKTVGRFPNDEEIDGIIKLLKDHQ